MQAVSDQQVHRLYEHAESMHKAWKKFKRHRRVTASTGPAAPQSPRTRYLSKLDIAVAPHAILSSRNDDAVVYRNHRDQRHASAPQTVSEETAEFSGQSHREEQPADVQEHYQPPFYESQEANHLSSYQSILAAALSGSDAGEFYPETVVDAERTVSGAKPQLSSSSSSDLPSQNLPPQQTDPDQQEHSEDHVAPRSPTESVDRADAQHSNELQELRERLETLSQEFEAQRRSAAQMSEVNEQLRNKLVEVHQQNNQNVGFAEQQVRAMPCGSHRQMLMNACVAALTVVFLCLYLFLFWSVNAFLPVLLMYASQLGILQQQLTQKTREVEALETTLQHVGEVAADRSDDNGNEDVAVAQAQQSNGVLRRFFHTWWQKVLKEHRRRVALRQFRDRKWKRLASGTLRRWRVWMGRQQAKRSPSVPSPSGSVEEEQNQVYVRVKYSPRATTTTTAADVPPLNQAGDLLQSAAEVCRKFQQRRTLRRWQMKVAASKHEEKMTIVAYQHLFSKMMRKTFRAWEGAVRGQQRQRFALQRCAAIAAEFQRRRVAHALYTWWRHAASAYYEQTIVSINIAAEERQQIAEHRYEELKKENDANKEQSASTRRQALEIQTQLEKAEQRIASVKSLCDQKQQALEQCREKLLEARRTESSIAGEMHVLQSSALDAKERAAATSKHAVELEEQLSVVTMELNNLRKTSAVRIAELKEEIAQRDRKYDELLETQEYERDDLESKIAELKMEVKNKSLGLDNAQRRMHRCEKDAEHAATNAANEIQAAVSREQALHAANIRLQEQLQEQSAEIAALRVRCATLDTELSEAKRWAHSSGRNIQRLEAELLDLAGSSHDGSNATEPASPEGGGPEESGIFATLHHTNVPGDTSIDATAGAQSSASKQKPSTHSANASVSMHSTTAIEVDSVEEESELDTSNIENSIQVLQQRMMQRLRSSFTTS